MSGRQTYRESEDMRNALEDYEKNGGSLVALARKYRVGYDALRRRANGELDVDAIQGRVQGLTLAEEDGLAEFALEMAEAGLGLTKSMVKEAAEYLVKDRPSAFGESGPSNNWFRAFLSRHEALSMRTPEKLSTLRRDACNPEALNAHFDRLQLLMDKHHYPLGCIWNADETSGSTNGKEMKILARKGNLKMLSWCSCCFVKNEKRRSSRLSCFLCILLQENPTL